MMTNLVKQVKINYIQQIRTALDKELNMGEDYEELLNFYALCVLLVGENCTNENIHDAWSVWQNITQPEHHSLKPFGELTEGVKDLDAPYCEAVKKVARSAKTQTS